jgi:hypothetical protein
LNPQLEISWGVFNDQDQDEENKSVNWVDFPSRESLAYLHLELAKEQLEGEQNAGSNNIGASWDESAWNEIFDSIDEEEEEEEEEMEWIGFSDTYTP